MRKVNLLILYDLLISAKEVQLETTARSSADILTVVPDAAVEVDQSTSLVVVTRKNKQGVNGN